MKQYIYKLIAIAGTFDRLHKGHRYFISQAFNLGEKVIIGLTSDEYAENKLSVKAESDKDGISRKFKIQNFQTRKRELDRFLEQVGLLARTEIIKIEDVYGPAIEDNEIEVLLVTDETFKGGEEVNKKRKELGLKPLNLLKIPIVLAEDKKRIASTRIRIGEIDRWGKVFESRITNNESRISDNLRQELKKPLGELIRGDSNNLMEIAEKLKKAVGKTNSIIISTVGDEVTKLCNEVGIPINLAIIDYKVRREKKYHSLSELGFLSSKALKTPQGWQAASHDSPGVEESVSKVKNPPGHITKELVGAVKNAYLRIVKDDKQRIIKVEGEEDLAGLPAILLAPLGSVILYGQPAFVHSAYGLRRGKPGSGVVMVEVTEAKKQELLSLIGSYSHNN